MSEAVAITPEFDPAADLAAAYERHMRNLIKIDGPSANTRASIIGHPCERHIFYTRTVKAEDRIAHAPQLQAIFELGKDFEKIAVRRLEDMGAEIVERGRPFVEPRYQLSGHIDLRLRMPGWSRALHGEVKGLNPYSGDKIRALEDIKNSPQLWIRKYYDQLQTYLVLAGDDLGVFVLFNKSTGWPTFINCRLDFEYAEGLLKKAERTKLAVLNNAVPERTLSSECRRCQFLHVCAPDMDYGPGVAVINDPELEAKIKRRDELKALAKEYAALDEDIKDALPKREGEILVGDYVITRKQCVKRPETKLRAGYTYFLTDIRSITKH